MRIRSCAFLLFVLAAPPLALAKDVAVKVGHKSLDPARVTVAIGDTVVFTNTQEMPGGHTVVADDGSFSSPALGKDKSFSHTFEKAGIYPVHVKEHPDTKGEIVVE